MPRRSVSSVGGPFPAHRVDPNDGTDEQRKEPQGCVEEARRKVLRRTRLARGIDEEGIERETERRPEPLGLGGTPEPELEEPTALLSKRHGRRGSLHAIGCRVGSCDRIGVHGGIAYPAVVRSLSPRHQGLREGQSRAEIGRATGSLYLSVDSLKPPLITRCTLIGFRRAFGRSTTVRSSDGSSKAIKTTLA